MLGSSLLNYSSDASLEKFQPDAKILISFGEHQGCLESFSNLTLYMHDTDLAEAWELKNAHSLQVHISNVFGEDHTSNLDAIRGDEGNNYNSLH